MKKTTIAAGLVSAFLFMGQGGVTSCSSGPQISYAIVAAGVQAMCGIVVPIADVTALVSANPALTTAAAVIDAICAAFKAQQAKFVASSAPTPPPTSGQLIVDGVLIHWTVK